MCSAWSSSITSTESGRWYRTARFASWPTRALTNLEFQIPVVVSTTPKRGLELWSDWLWPQLGQYWEVSGTSELQYQQVVMGGNSRPPARRPLPVQNLRDGRSGGAFPDSGGFRAESLAGDSNAPPKLRPARRPAPGGGRASAAHPFGSSPEHRPVGSAGQRQDHARAAAGERDQRADGRDVRRHRGGGRPAQGGGRGQSAPARRPAHGAVHRRDPPLQQGAAGRHPASRRGWNRDLDRRHNRKSFVRGDLAAPVAQSRLPAGAARPGRAEAGRRAGAGGAARDDRGGCDGCAPRGGAGGRR